MSSDELDTGTGGFSVDGKMQTYDVGVESNSSSTVPYSSGNIKAASERPDLSKSTKRTLASYLSSATSGKTSTTPIPNTYPISHNVSEDPSDLKLRDESGYPQNLSTPNVGQKHFANLSPGDGRSLASNDLKLIRGLQSSPNEVKLDGNELLRSVVEYNQFQTVSNPAGGIPNLQGVDQRKENIGVKTVNPNQNSPVTKYTNSVLLKNRFSPGGTTYEKLDSPGNYGDGSSREENIAHLRNSQFAAKYPLGSSLSPEAPRPVTFGKLSQIGTALMTKAAGEAGSSSNNPTGSTAEALAILPGVEQIGVTQISRGELEVSKILEKMPEIEDIDENYLINPTGSSWGTINSSIDQFSGISNFGMMILSTTLLVALSVIISLLSLIFGLLLKTSNVISKDGVGRYLYGISKQEASESGSGFGLIFQKLSAKDLLGLSTTVYEIDKTIPVGALAFFGSTVPSASASSMAVEALKAALGASFSRNSGYYVVMSRCVSRSFLQIGAAFASLKTAFSNLTGGIKKLLDVFGGLKDTKFLRIVDIFSQLGDRIILDATKGEQYTVDQSSSGAGTRFKSKIDNNTNTDAVSKSRLNVDVNSGKISALTLAWASYRSPDMFIMPDNVLGMKSNLSTQKLGMPSMMPTVSSEDQIGGLKNGGVYQSEGKTSGRIEDDIREKLEDSLESEYMPFYFHDVRTNEIVSFHAFLASLSDGYTSNYDQVEAFGRVEPIKIYKSTTRKIGFSFYVVATNPDDFNSMWMKLNKLTTFAYPQFSKGRLVQSGNNKFYAPFSQVIQASPMIRLRLGDLIKSNYSKFNLARLFGYGLPETQFNQVNAPNQTSGDYLESIKSTEKAFVAKPGCTYLTSRDISISSGAVGKVQLPFTLPTGFVLKVIKETKTEDDVPKVECVVEKASGEDALNLPDYINYDYYSGQGGEAFNINGKNFIVAISSLVPTVSTTKKKDASLKSSGYTNEMINFLNEDGQNFNAISRSFKTSGGKGLAGFIDSINFDWYDKVTWEIGRGVDSPGPEIGRRAPKFCKVDVSFSPIHDITPGLDSSGVNRAPIYPVGSHSPHPVYDLKSLTKKK